MTTRKQQRELVVIRRFVPDGYSEPTEEDVRAFFAWSDRGIGRDAIVLAALESRSGLAGLYWGKRHRDLAVTSFRADWGRTCFPEDFETEEAAVRDYLLASCGPLVTDERRHVAR